MERLQTPYLPSVIFFSENLIPSYIDILLLQNILFNICYLKIIGQNTSSTSTKTPCDQQQDMALNISLIQLGVQIPEIIGCESLVEYSKEKLGMTAEKVCDSTIMTLSDKLKQTKKSKNSVRAMRSNLQDDPKDIKFDSYCKCTCPQGRSKYLILNT